MINLHRRFRWIALAALTLVLWAAAPNAAEAEVSINLRPHLCVSSQADQRTARQEPSLSSCDRTSTPKKNRWVWARLDDPRRLDPLPARWHLMLPHRQLDAVAVLITFRDGTVERITRLDGALSVDWSPRGHASFVSSRPGSDVAALAIGYKSKNTNPLKYVKAVPKPAFEKLEADFRLVVGLFLGAVGSALIYNLFIGAGFRYPFQRVYIVWGSLALLNGVLAAGILNEIWPALAGPVGILANKFVLALLFASGTLFLLELIEEGILPRPLVRLGRITAVTVGAVGPLAVIESWLSVSFVGQLNASLTGLNIAVIAAVALVAARRGSRAVCFYLAGWSPILVFGLFLVAYEAGAIAHSQALEIGGMLAVAFESVVLSLAIADRFRHIQHARNLLERAQQMAEADRVALQYVANTDQLTGLNNRRAFDATLAAAKRGEITRLALILIDIDHFKTVNDRLGHEAGDELLRQVAQQLRGSVRANDIVARLGGDEFAILLKDGDAKHADQIMKELLAAQRHVANEVTFSIGAALLPDDDADPAQLYRNADLALYEAKREGRARSQRYSQVLHSRDRTRLSAG
jgi:diguanylate cyclase (GGDEF)-like protein